MKRLAGHLCAALLVLWPATATAQGGRQSRSAPGGQEWTETVSRTVQLGRNGTFELRNIAGDIVIEGGGGADVRIEATKRVRHRDEAEARALLDQIRVEVIERAGTVEVRTDHPRRRNGSGRVDYAVSLPREANVTLRTVSGSLRVTDVNGELRAESVSGRIVASSTRRIRLAKTVSGDLEISQAESDELTAGTVSGRIIVKGLSARALDAETVSGLVRVTDVEAERASMRSVSGYLEYGGRLSRNGRYELQSHSGDVRIVPVAPAGFSIEANTFSGELRSDYPLTLRSTPGNDFAPRRRNRSIRGTYGEVGAAIVLQSFSGNIAVVKE